MISSISILPMGLVSWNDLDPGQGLVLAPDELPYRLLDVPESGLDDVGTDCPVDSDPVALGDEVDDGISFSKWMIP
jgi:hypothetical protein